MKHSVKKVLVVGEYYKAGGLLQELERESPRDRSLNEDLVRFYQEELGQLSRDLIQLRREMQGIQDSLGWKIFQRLQRAWTWIVPAWLRRSSAFRRTVRACKWWLDGGSKAVFEKAWAALPLPARWKSWSKPDGDGDAAYQNWMTRIERPEIAEAKSRAATLPYRPRISLLMPVYNIDAELLRTAVESVRGQCYCEWELCICNDGSTKPETVALLGRLAELDTRIKVESLEKNQGIARATQRALDLATGEFIGLLDSDDELAPHALYEVARFLNEQPQADFLYSDRDKMDEAGRRFEPFFKPDWSPDLFFSCNYLCHLVVMRTRLARAAGGFRADCEGSQDYDLFLRVLEKTHAIHHLAKVLYHWRVVPTSTAGDVHVKMHAHGAALRAIQDALERRGVAAEVRKGHSLGFWRVKYPVPASARVAVVLLSGGNVRLLDQCLAGLLNKTAFRNFEIILVDNSKGEEVSTCFARLKERAQECRYVDARHAPFNYSHLNNLGAENARAPLLLFLNDDVFPLSSDWLEALLEHAHRPEVGAVGPLLLYDDRTIQHAGIVMGLNGCCDHGLKHLPAGDIGYHHFHNLTRNCSAVTGACLLTRRDVFLEVGGFDDRRLPIAFQDVDLCLKMREKGYLIVYTPFARLFHYEGQTKGANGLAKVAGFEIELMQQRWGNVIADDPYYSPHLSRDFPGYRLDDRARGG